MVRLRRALALLQLVKSFAVGRTKANVNTPAPVPQNGSGHLIPAFHGTGRTFSLLPSHPLDAASCSIDAPLGLVLERQSSQAKDGFVESKKVSIVFRAELTAGDERAARLSPKTRTQPESTALGGGVSGTLIWWCAKGFCYEGSVSQIHGRGQNFLTERRGVGFLRHLANILARSHCWAIFLFECHN